MARDPEDAVPFAFGAKKEFGRGAMLVIVIRTSDWLATLALNARDNVPMTRGPSGAPTGGLQSFVPLALLRQSCRGFRWQLGQRGSQLAM